ncbi:Uncharacterised protein [Mycobacterium tuberculosis]|nr:Uncharacterised protein [Mycobacterium tuberculosis]
MARRRSRNAPARGGAVVWHDGHQCARHCRAGTGASPRIRCTRRHPGHTRYRRRAAVRAVGQLAGRAAADRRAAGRLGRRPRTRAGAGGSGLHPGPPARTPAGAHRRTGRHHRGADRGAAGSRHRRTPLPTRGRPRRPRTGLGVLRARLAMGGHGRRPAGHRTGIRRHHRRDRTTDRRGIRLLGDRSHDRPRGRDRHRPGATDPVCHAGRAGGHNEVLRRSARRGHRPLAGRVRGRGGRRRALPRRRSARHLPAVGADDPYRRRRRHGIGGTACSTSAFGVDGARRQRRRGRGGGLPAVHRDRRGHPDGTRPGGRLGATRRAGP